MTKIDTARTARSRMRGFSLIELVITIAIIGILTTIAVGSYRESVAKARRGDAVSALLAGAQALERYYSTNGRYTTSAGGTTLAAVWQSTQYYTITSVADAAGDNTFTLRATRTGAMTNDACGNFDITHTGVLSIVSGTNASDKTEAYCLRR